MKVYRNKNYNKMYYVGNVCEIKSIYNSVWHAVQKNHTELGLYFPHPQFDINKEIYALCVDYDNMVFYVINSDTMLSLIIHDDVGVICNDER